MNTATTFKRKSTSTYYPLITVTLAITTWCLCSGFSYYVRVTEVKSGDTFLASDGETLKAIVYEGADNLYTLSCLEPDATEAAKRLLLNQRIMVSYRGKTANGMKLADISINGKDYFRILENAGLCKKGQLLARHQNTSFTKSAPRAMTPNDSHGSQPEPVKTPPDYSPDAEGKLPEAYWRDAFNELFANGVTEVSVENGRADIVNDYYAIEVDSMQKWKESIGQALHYAAETGKRPAVALFDDGLADHSDALEAARRICAKEGITLWVINDHVPQGYEIKGGIAISDTINAPDSWAGWRSRSSDDKATHIGPRNGKYYYTDSGKKRYYSSDR